MNVRAPIGQQPDEIARALARGAAWSTTDSAVEWIQTHISHVFLVEDRVFKLRKAVRLSFLDFGTREQRNADCVRELELNRRLAASVYLGLAPVIQDEDDVRIGAVQEPTSDPDREHVVVMRRLPAGRDALSLLEKDLLEPRHLEAVAARLQPFHAEHALGRPAPWDTQAWRERIVSPILACLPPIADSKIVDRVRLESIESRIRSLISSLSPELEKRRLEGRAVDGHGDLHLDHVWFEEGREEPLIIDCLEFSEDLRHIDCASEIAFLAMDLHYRGRPDLADGFASAYALRSDDYGMFAVIDFFAAYRALVRAKVAALAVPQPSIEVAQRAKARASVDRHLGLAEALLEPRAPGELILLCGTVGSGKSSVARVLCQSGRGVPIASDRVRKALVGIEVSERATAPPDQGLYRPERTERVYRALLERAEPVISGGRTAILDASFTQRAQREAARGWASERGVPIRLIEVRCDPGIAEARLRERERAGRDPSDAGPDFLPVSLSRFEAPDEWPSEDHQVVSTSDDDWQAALLASLE